MEVRQILVVEDDRDVRLALVEALELEGFTVASASHGEEAIDLLRRTATLPRVVLLDLMMPVLDGFGVVAEMRKVPAWARVPVYILTADGRVDEAVVAPPVIGLLKKPVRLLDLLARLDDLCP